jgi:hypothetical protein
MSWPLRARERDIKRERNREWKRDREIEKQTDREKEVLVKPGSPTSRIYLCV